MDTPVMIMILSFIVLLVTNVPIAVAIGISTFFTVLCVTGSTGTADKAMTMIAQRMATGIDSFSLLAIPFFILSGIFMGRGGIAARLINFASTLVGRFKGGLAFVNILTCMFFGAISGSAVAAVSSVGGFMIPEMNKKGYENDFNVTVSTTAATTGLLIPPSNIMIVYALVSGGVSIAAMFMAGFLPGIISGVSLILVASIISRKKDYGAGHKASFKQILIAFKRAFLSLLLIVIVLGGILKGIFTPTEAAAIAVVYSFILSVLIYREVKPNHIPKILLECGITTSVVMLLIGTSSAMSWILAYENIPQNVSSALLSLSDNKIVIFLIINLILLFVGTFMDMTPAVLIFTPIFLPIAVQLGVHPVHFGIIIIMNLCIGLCTPPVGTALFVGCGVGNTTISKITKHLIPFFIAMVAALLLVTYLPAISLFVPKLFKLI
jgi:tripartite ATP-independent transporter DctM subunit